MNKNFIKHRNVSIALDRIFSYEEKNYNIPDESPDFLIIFRTEDNKELGMFWFDSVEERELFIKDNLLSIKKCKHEWMPYKWLSINKYDEVRTDDKVAG